jgi:phage-related tail fiber protein
MTDENAKSYNTRVAGIQRSLAAIEASGLAPGGSLTHQMDAVVFKAGDTNKNKLEKLAEIRQIVEAGVDQALTNPGISDEQRTHADKVIKSIRKAVPFTMADVDKLTNAQNIDSKATLKSVMKNSSDKGPAVGAVEDGFKFKGGDPSDPMNWEKVK